MWCRHEWPNITSLVSGLCKMIPIISCIKTLSLSLSLSLSYTPTHKFLYGGLSYSKIKLVSRQKKPQHINLFFFSCTKADNIYHKEVDGRRHGIPITGTGH